jgi:HK97 family phage prohead protease
MRRQFFTAHARSDGLAEGQLVFDLVTGDKDSFKTVLRPEGAKFRPAKPWLDTHDDKSCKKVIGRMSDEPLEQSADRLRVLVNFDLESPEAAEVYRKHKAGFLEGCSVGFDPISYHIEDVDGEETLVYDEYWVLEGSSCAVPSNPMALMQRSADQTESARLKLDDALRAAKQAKTSGPPNIGQPETPEVPALVPIAPVLAPAAAPVSETRAVVAVEPAETFAVREPSDIHHPQTETQGKRLQMKPEHRSLHRYMIGSSLGRAADHMDAMGAFPAGHEHRAFHRACAERAMDDASHMTRMVMEGIEEGHDDAAADAEMIGSMIRACNVEGDEALAKRWESCQRSALAYASTTWREAGKQIGVSSPDDLVTQIRAHEAVAARHKKLLAQHRSVEQANVSAERFELVKGLVGKGLASPALEAEMLGFDPADPKRERRSKLGPWSPERIRRFAMQVEGALPEIVTRAAPVVTTDGKVAPQSDFVPGVPDVKLIPQVRSAGDEALAAAIAGSAKYLGIKSETLTKHATQMGRK